MALALKARAFFVNPLIYQSKFVALSLRVTYVKTPNSASLIRGTISLLVQVYCGI